MRRQWSRKAAWDDGFFLVFLDVRGGLAADKVLLARATKGGYTGHIYRLRGAKRELRKDSIGVGRPDKRSIRLKVPFGKLGLEDGRKVYRWSAMTIFNGRGCRRACLDALQSRAMFPDLPP
jgi:hypothetical protein